MNFSKQSLIYLIATITTLSLLFSGCADSNHEIAKSTSTITPLPTSTNSISTNLVPARSSEESANKPSSVENPKDALEDFNSGYKAGLEKGAALAESNGNNEIPLQTEIDNLAANAAKNTSPNDLTSFTKGFNSGFYVGFDSITKGIGAQGFERLSVDNAKNGVKLYNAAGKQVARIISVDSFAGIVTVKYDKEGNDAIEKKQISALSKFWYVRKDESIFKP